MIRHFHNRLGRRPAKNCRAALAREPGRKNLDMSNLEKRDGGRNSRRQYLVQHLHAAGPRPVLEALLEVEAGRDLDCVLERYAEIPIGVYRAVGADTLPIEALTVVDGGVA